jgi:hypothetical protein
MDDFAKRVRMSEEAKNKNAFDLNLSKPIDEYLINSANIYFNLTEMDTNSIYEAKEFYQAFFGIGNQDIKPINDVKIEHKEHEVIGIRERVKHELKSISLITPNNIDFLLDYNEENKIIDTNTLVKEIFENITNANRKTKAYSNLIYSGQKEIVKKITEWAKNNNRDDVLYTGLNTAYDIVYYNNPLVPSVLISGSLRNNVVIDEFEITKDVEANYAKQGKVSHFIKTQDCFKNIKQKFNQATMTDIDKNGYVKKRLNDLSIRRIFGDVFESAGNYKKEENGLKEILSHANKDDNILIGLILDKRLDRYLKMSDNNKKEIASKINETGLLNDIIESSFEIKYLALSKMLFDTHNVTPINNEYVLTEIFDFTIAKKLIDKEINSSDLIDKGLVFDYSNKEIKDKLFNNTQQKVEKENKKKNSVTQFSLF